jgi:hypothetical protein
VVADAVAEGLIARAGAASADEKPAGNQLGTEEPLAEWERELLEGSSAETPAAETPAAETPAAETPAATSPAATYHAAAAPPATVTRPDEPIVAAAEVEGAADREITAESASGSEEVAEQDQADDLEGLAETADETRGDAEFAAAEATGALAAADEPAAADDEIAADDQTAADETPLAESIGAQISAAENTAAELAATADETE